MAHYLVTRHSGAVDWLARQGYAVEHWVSHLEVRQVQAGDLVIGTLPMHLAAQVCARGARYLHLAVDLPAEARGRELTAAELTRYGARLEEYRVQALPQSE